MKTTALPKDPGPAAWDAILPPSKHYASLDCAITADWLVIGAGFAGLSAARRLRLLHPKDRVVLLEARRIAEGPVGRNTGFMIDLPHNLTSSDYAGAVEKDRAQAAQNRFAIQFAKEAAADYGFAPDTLVQSGKTNGAATAKGDTHNRDYAHHLSGLNEPHELLDARQMQEMCGTDYYQSGLYTPGTVMLQPALYAREMAKGLALQNIKIFENSAVKALKREGATWKATTSSGTVEAPKVILAVNGHLESFGFFKRRLMHIYLFASMTRALTEAEDKALGGKPVWAITPADPLGSTVRKIRADGGSRIVIRNGFTWSPGRASNPRKPQKFARIHDRTFAARFPQLAEISGPAFEHRWGGLLCLSRNGVSAFGEVDDGLFAAGCQNGLGAARGTLSGILAADLASGETSDHLEVMLAEAAPTLLPPEPLATIGATTAMKWGEFKAGMER